MNTVDAQNPHTAIGLQAITNEALQAGMRNIVQTGLWATYIPTYFERNVVYMPIITNMATE
jgi:hypothetical protein